MPPVMNGRLSRTIRTVLTVIAIAGIAALVLYLAGGRTASGPANRPELVIWGWWRGEGWEKLLARFREMHPELSVVISTSAGRMDEQKLMCAIAGDSPPDVINQDRFSVGGWAARGAFLPLDEFIRRDLAAGRPDAIRPEDYYPACWNEAVYQGKVYAIPSNTDDRILYYNEDILRREGFVNADGSVRPPRTWEELQAYAVKMTKRDDVGNITQVGFVPMYGNSWLYLYAWQNGGAFLSADGRTCTMNQRPVVETLRWVTAFYEALGGVQQVDAFTSTPQTGDLDPFLTGKIAMMVNGNWILNTIATYKPDMNFGVAPAPVPASRLKAAETDPSVQPYITWSGGFSWAVPASAKHPEIAWDFIRWISSPDAARIFHDAESRYNRSRGRRYVPSHMSPNRKINEQVVLGEFAPKDKRLHDAFEFCVSMMPASRFRPVTPVGQLLWDEHVRATDRTRHHDMTAQEAADVSTARVQAQLDLLYERKTYPPLDTGAVGTAATVLAGAGIIAFIIGAARHVRRYARGPSRREAVVGYAFIGPWLAGFLLLTAGPILASLVLSFCEYDVLHPVQFVGLDNYAALPGDPIFWRSLVNTLWMVGAVPLGMAVGLGVALLLNMNVRGQRFYRTAYYLPAIVPIVAASILWIWLLQPQFGLINSTLRLLHVPDAVNGVLRLVGLSPPYHFSMPMWLQDADWSKPALILMGLWGAGAGMIIWLAGLKGIPRELYEAAEIDGAGRLSRFRHITLPMLSPYIFFNLVMGTIGAFQVFTNAYIMTNGEGGPVDSTLFYVFALFNHAFRYFKMGYASAMAWILFLIILALTMINWRLRKIWVFTERGDV
jgi:multiple sugar transport system permease protein